MQRKYKLISLFSGCGGADLGMVGGFSYLGKQYKKNSVEVIHASDIDSKAVDTYNANFDHPAVVADVQNLNFAKHSADIVIGGFPCQSFSTVNPTKQPNSKKNQLFWEMVRIVDQVKPKVFVAENVKGFYRLEGGKYFNLAKDAFEDLGYTVFHNLFCAADYGVPQLRERIIIVGIRNDIAKKTTFKFADPLYGEDSLSKRPYVNLGAVVKSLIPDDEKYYFSKRAVEGVKRAKPNMKRAVAQSLDRPCLTITSHLAKVSLNSRDPVLLVNPKKELYRRFSPREAASIQSFPYSFKFVGSQSSAYRQIGNAIPPVMMWHIAQSVIAVLDQFESRKFSKASSYQRILEVA